MLEDRAVAWLADRAQYLDPEMGDESTTLFARKALVEVALLVGMRAREGALTPDYERLLDLIADVSERAFYRESIAQDRRSLLLYAGTYAALRLCGRENPAFRHAITQAVRVRTNSVPLARLAAHSRTGGNRRPRARHGSGAAAHAPDGGSDHARALAR
jgi:hypothetical protein